MFPYEGSLKNLSAKNCYTRDEIKEILNLAAQFKLEVIPLVQTFGHMEFALKHEEWSKIREISNSPQAVCPSRNNTLDFIGELTSQVINTHTVFIFLTLMSLEVLESIINCWFHSLIAWNSEISDKCK